MGLKERERSAGSSGLALVLQPEEVLDRKNGLVSNSPRPHCDAVSAAATVIDSAPVEISTKASATKAEIDFQAVAHHVAEKFAATDSEYASDSEAPWDGAGRLGPEGCTMLEVRGACSIFGESLLCREGFSSVRANVAVVRGRWQYEVQLRSAGIMQIGWTTLGARFTIEEGVGDSQDSYAYDGKRQRRWNVAAVPYGERWTAGDIITCSIDMDEGFISYWRNGVAQGVAFDAVRRHQPGLAYFPGISLSYSERCDVNFGGRPLRYPVPGYQPLQAPPPQLPGARYMSACFSRLLDATAPPPPPPHSPLSAAALAASRAVPFAGEPAAPSGGNFMDNEERGAEESFRGMHLGTPESGGSKGGGRPAMRRLCPIRMMDGTVLHGGAEGTLLGEAQHAEQEQALGAADAALLAAALGQYLGPLCHSRYVAEAVALPLLEGALAAEDGKLERLLRLLWIALEPSEVAALACAVCAALGSSARACTFRPADFPKSSALRALSLWETVLHNPDWRGAWLGSGRWPEQLEDLLTVRQPPSADLASVLPNLVWREGEDYAMILAGSTGDGAFVGDMQALSGALAWVEMAQSGIIAAIWSHSAVAEPHREGDAGMPAASGGSDSGSPPPAKQPASWQAARAAQRDAPHHVSPPIADFLNWLVEKNRGAARNVPPPGLSDPSVLVSTFFALLRLLRPQLDAVHVAGDAFSWPAGAFLMGIPGSQTDDPYGDAVRLGGTLSHLSREFAPQLGADAEGEAWRTIPVPEYRLHGSGRPGWAAEAPPAAQLPDLEGMLHWWAWDRLLVLYHLGVASRVRLGFTHMNTLEQALGTLGVMQGRLESERSAPGRELLSFSINECKRTIVDSLRQYGWHAAWLLPGWKQESALALAATVCRVVTAVAQLPGGLLRFVPELYLESALDMMHSGRRAEGRVWPTPEDVCSAGLDSVITAAATLVGDARVVSPEARAMLLQTTWVLLQEGECLECLPCNPVAAARLLPALLELMADQRSWVQVANTLLLVVAGTGLLALPPPENGGGSAAARAVVQQWFKEAVEGLPATGAAFTNALFDHVNWALTELVVVLEELDATAASDGRAAAQHQRRAAVTADLCLTLLRLLEFSAARAPWALFLDPEKSLNATRMAEIVAFGVRQLAAPKLRDILRRRGVGSDTTAAHVDDRRLRRSLMGELLAPYGGILLALTKPPPACYQAQPESQPQSPQESTAEIEGDVAARLRPLGSFEAALVAQGLGSEQLRDAIHLLEAMAVEPPGSGLPPLTLPLAQLNRLVYAADVLSTAEEAAAEAAKSVDGAGVPEEEAPPEFLDPIMQTLMTHPVVLPHSGVVVDRETIERHLLSSATDPFSRAPLRLEDVAPAEELRGRIQEWAALHLHH